MSKLRIIRQKNGIVVFEEAPQEFCQPVTVIAALLGTAFIWAVAFAFSL